MCWNVTLSHKAFLSRHFKFCLWILKGLDGAHPAAFKEMIHVISFLLNIQYYGSKIATNLDENAIWDFVCFSNSYFESNTDSWWSILGYILDVKNVQISWLSKAQKSVTLSTPKAKFITLSDVVKWIMFFTMEVKVNYSREIWTETLFVSRGGELRFPAEVASMCALNYIWLKRCWSSLPW